MKQADALSALCASMPYGKSVILRGLGLGDLLILVLGLVAIVALVSWHGRAPDDHVIIRQGGRLLLESDLRLDRTINVTGPLGVTQVQIRAGQVRVLADPGPRQLCVLQGWIPAGGAAICLPNRVSVERGRPGYDTLHY